MLKRAFDVVASLLGLLVTLPLWPVIAVAVKLDSPGPVLYRSTRVGQGGKTIRVLKFRTMVASGSSGPHVTVEGDPRITRTGRWLRKLKLDEIPQLVNVLRGDMSMVGPRPEDPRYVALYTPEQRQVLSVRPGLVSPAVIKYRHEERLLVGGKDLEETYVNVILPDKLKLDLEYIARSSVLFDLRLLAKAFTSIFKRPNLPEAESSSGCD